jgi:hypothetical protein
MKVIKDLFASKKFVVMLVGIIGYVLSRFGFDVSAEKIEPIIAVIAAYLVGQGIADVGARKPAPAAPAVVVVSDSEKP